MLFTCICITAALLNALVTAQLPTYSTSSIPTGTPIPGKYNGPLRPQIHYSPPSGFMNDPNGLFIDASGIWHLYYQYNPNATVAGNQHWGHATSPDLYHWINQQIALFPPANDTFVFSGSCVVDVNNTSGFFPSQDNGVVAIYTLAHYPNGVAGPQTQNIAYSTDGGFTFTPYTSNPVIDSKSSQFRDPKVIWYQDHWVMVLAYAVEFTVGIYTSPDLKTWTHTSNFSHYGLLGLQYECPNLVEMPIRNSATGSIVDMVWVLQISINPGAPLGGSIAQYFIGSFNGTHFSPLDNAARIADFGKDNYAGQFFYGVDRAGDAVSIAWASNWQYTQFVPTGELEGWRSAMTLPRRNYVTKIERVGYVMTSSPWNINTLTKKVLASNSSLGNGSIVVDYTNTPSNAVHLSIKATNIKSALLGPDATVNFTFSSQETKESISGGFFFAGDASFWLDREGIKEFDNPYFTDKMSTTDIVGSTWSVEVVIDRSILEVFLNGGTRSATTSFFPLKPLTNLVVRSGGISGGIELEVEVRSIESAWKAFEDESGVVAGNVTGSGKHKRGMTYEANFL